jgi:hypothetical protein
MLCYGKTENNMNKSISMSAVTSVVMALSMQAHAGEKISVASEGTDAWVDQVNAAISGKESREAIQSSMVDLAKNVVVDGSESAIDVSVILQAGRDDSSLFIGNGGKPRYDSNGVNYCYGNCHTACHGSRNWR